jgi:DNA helicase-2/ATP-dependent DNA helicase PcrA
MSSNHSNKVIIASAGSRKTTYIVKVALSNPDENILILTYTIDNIGQIRSYIIRENGFIPTNITILSWYSFLLQECVRPYQNFLYSDKRIETVYFPPDIGKFNLDRRFIK